jgi:iron-sulfur cluster repair protein YtfE (RIC family)
MNKPIKRHESLQSLSRDHHQALLLCWKINKGLSKEIDAVRIKKYADWFYLNHLLPHFQLEEEHIFPILGNDHELIKKAIQEHRQLEALFNNSVDAKVSLQEIETVLEQHVRFEERILFNTIQDVATPEQLQMIKQVHQEEKFCENDIDPFWL